MTIEEEEEDGQIVSLDDSCIERVRGRLAIAWDSGPGVQLVFMSLEALKTYCVMRASAPYLYSVCLALWAMKRNNEHSTHEVAATDTACTALGAGTAAAAAAFLINAH